MVDSPLSYGAARRNTTRGCDERLGWHCTIGEVDVRGVRWDMVDSPLSYVGARGNAMRGSSGVASDNRPWKQPSPIGRERRGAACVAQAPQSIRPPLQAAPSAGSACRVPPCPGCSEHVRRVPFSDRVVVFTGALRASLDLRTTSDEVPRECQWLRSLRCSCRSSCKSGGLWRRPRCPSAPPRAARQG